MSQLSSDFASAETSLPPADLAARALPSDGAGLHQTMTADVFPPDEPLPVGDDDLLTDHVECVLFALTSNCNLRCTYCAVSQPFYVGRDFDLTKLDQLSLEMAEIGVDLVQISGHGETTILPDWAKYCTHFLDRGIEVCITSNFSNVFDDEEVDALARMQFINISIDTADRELLKRLRRKVDIKTILYNMQNVRLRAKQAYGRDVVYNWQCTLSDAVVAGVSDWVQLGLLYGVKHFTFGNLIELTGLVDPPKHVAHLEGQALTQACDSIRNALEIAREAGAGVTVQPGIVEGINASLVAQGFNEAFSL